MISIQYLLTHILPRSGQRLCLFTKKRWNDLDSLLIIIFHITNGQGQLSRGSSSCQLGEAMKPVLCQRILPRHFKGWMKKKILMSHTYLRNAHREKGTGDSAKHLIEIDHDVSPTLHDVLAKEINTGKILRHKECIISNGTLQKLPSFLSLRLLHLKYL